ncbi:UDP-Glycosyltransferase superfamily protein [Forsythia ovata]|uniref:UDP-Glycosyltransferase superfamily protein n=1 Tax=Forsythia ovata TaxID=205694 RepID=A0ABD1QCK6_9LAMI
MVPKVAATWHGIWHEILHSKLFQDLLVKPKEQFPAGQITDLQEAMLWLLDEIRFFSSYTQYLCISNSAGEVLRNIYQLPQRNVHVILKSMELMKTNFVHDSKARVDFGRKQGIPSNTSLVGWLETGASPSL